jgi:predicted ribosomally synthesized peptide with nif11-like leader
MKTLEEFIQRLQNDAAFERQAQAFDHGDDLIAFVKREGYDFTLEQLMSEFGPVEKLPAETGGLAPAPADVGPSTPPKPADAAFPRKPEALSGGERDTGQIKSRNDNFTREQPAERLQPPKNAMPRPEPEAEPPAGLVRGSGGRHRGFSPQKLKSISEEEPL